MTEIVNMHDAKTHFSKLVAKVEAGEEIVIARGGRPCARLVPFAPEVPRLGTMKGRWPELADEFFEALTGDELDAWDALKLLLDTHIFVWAATGDRRLPPDAATLIVDPTNTRTLSVASVWEMSIKAASGRWAEVAPMLDDLDEALHDLQTGQLPIDVPAAVAAGRLDWEHRDPFDRMLAAQAALGGFSLLTVDRAFDRAGIALALS